MRHNRSARSSRPGAARLGSVASCRMDSADKNTASLPGFDDPPGARGEDRGGQPVGDSHLAFGSGRRHRIDQPLGRRLLGTEVARRAANRQHQQAGPQHLGARHQVVHRCRHVFEVAGIARRVGGDDVQLRAPGLGLPTAQAAPHPDRASRRRAGDDPVGQRDRHRRRRGQTRPPTAAATAGQSMHQMASTRDAHAHPPTACTDPKLRPLARMANRTRLIRPHPDVGLPPLPPVTS